MIRRKRAHLFVAAQSHPGLTGKQNEDAYAVSAYHLSAADPTPALFAVVADGIGGHRAGEVASEMAVDRISQVVAESDGSQPLKTLSQAIYMASEDIAGHSVSGPERAGMGSTCACALVIGERLYTTSVGDSRIYLLRQNGILQLSTDHSWVQEAMDKGILTADEARQHPNVHVIRRYLGSDEPPEADFRLRLKAGEGDAHAEANQGMPIQPGDIVLLCTDGLTDMVWDDEILWAVRTAGTLEKAAKLLVGLACERGGHDNITLILIGRPKGKRPAVKGGKRPGWPLLAGLIGAGLVVLAGGLSLGVALVRRGREVPSTPAVLAFETRSPPAATAAHASATLLPGATRPPGTPPAPPGPTYTPWPTNTSSNQP